MGNHLSELAHLSIEEFESIISATDLMGNPITPVLRGKLRQVLLTARIVVGVTRAPDPSPQTPGTIVVQAPPQPPPEPKDDDSEYVLERRRAPRLRCESQEDVR